MKKLLFTFLALMVLSTSAWATATTIAKETQNMGWTTSKVYQSFNLDDNISVYTSGKGTNDNGLYHTNKLWYIYQNSPSKGKFTIKVKSGYRIQWVAITFSTNSGASLQDPLTSTLITSGSPYMVYRDSVSFIVYNTEKSDMAKVSKFSVTYASQATALTMDEAMTVSVGNSFQIGIPTPNDAYCDWSSSDASKVSVDQNGVITAKAITTKPVNITAKGNGFEKTCAVTVVATTEKTITETFSKAETSDTWQGQSTNAYSVNGDNDLLHWIMRSIRRASGDKVGGVQATRISYNKGTNYIAYNNSSVSGSTPMEGGVKRISFQWIAANNSNPVVFDVDNNGQPNDSWITYKTYLLGNPTWQSTQTYSRDVNMAKNVQFRIKLTNASSVTMNIGPLTITPYLLFTNKAVTASNGFYKFNDDDLINNTGTTLAKANFEVSDANAASIDEDGTIRSKQDNKTITLTAKWGDVTTTTKLTTKLVDPAGSFALGAAVITKNIGDADFDNAFNKTVGDAFTYKSSNEDVATVDENGTVHIVNGGTTQIKAVFEASAPYKAKEFAYTLDVTHTPTEAYFAESFDSIPVGTIVSLAVPQVFGGNGGVYRWQWKNTQRNSGETIGSYTSPKLMNNYGEIAMADVAEGGIKEVAFRYKAKGTTLPIHFFVKAGDKVVEMQRPKSSATLSFAHQFNMADSVGLSIYLGATETPNQQTHILLDTVKIVPYLLYTKKVAAASAADGAYTNTNLINNTGGTPEYSISCPEDVATINPETGAVTILKSDTVTVTATWGKVKTTYTLQMQAKQIPVINFAASSLNKDLLAGEFTNKLTTPAGVGDITYSSSNKDVATVDAEGKVTMHSIGDATITATIAESTTYAATSKSYTLTVGFTPAAGKFWTETFSAIPVKDGYKNVDTVVIGDNGVYNWTLNRYAHRSADKVGGSNKQAYQGICKSENGYIKTNDMEGGVKCIAFDWSPKNSTGAIDYSVKVGDSTYEYVSEAKNGNQIYQYARLAGAKQNANLEFKLENFVSTAVSAYIVFGKMTIVPYLLYTKKADTINIVDYSTDKYINNNLINNIDEGSVAYSIVESTPANIASIEDATKGEITILAGGVIKVQAKWGDVTTTYTLKINKIAPEVKFAKSSIDTTMNAEAVTNAFTAPAGAGAITYKSSDARIAKVDAEGVVAVVGAGTVTITADVAENETYQAASANYTLNITDPEEFAIEETFPDYAGSPWMSNAQVGPVDVIGELDTWSISYARHSKSQGDTLKSGERAVWFNTNGYIETKNVFEGGIKRVQFIYEKRKVNKVFSVIAGDVKDTITADNLKQEYTYNHNFFLKKNGTLKIHNICATSTNGQDMFVGTIKVTPYLYFSQRADTIKASNYVGKEPYIIEGLKNNTGSSNIIYRSSNPEVAQVNNGEVTVYADAAEPVIITAAWAASETDTVTTTFSLQINGKDQRVASFSQDSVSVARGNTPENTLNITPVEGETTPVVAYESSNEEVAMIGANNTVITVGPGTATITAKIGATDKCMAGEARYVLTVTYTPATGTFWKETFSNAGDIGSYTTDTINGDDGTIDKWILTDVMRPTSDLVGAERGIRIKYEGNIANNVALEGGIKEVVFNWRPLNTMYAPHFYVQVGDSVHGIKHEKVINANIVLPYAHNFGNQGKSNNATLKIGNYAQETPTAQGYVVIGEVNVLPYLLYTTKKDTLDMKDSHSYKMVPQIDNRDNEEAIEYSIIAGNENSIAQIAADGTVTANASGTITVQAAWSGVTTTYQLTIWADKTTIFLVRNDGTENVDTIVNNRDEVAPTITLPTREGYQFNAYWTKPDTATGSYRFTVTTAAGATVWVSNRTINKEKVTGDERVWIYKGSYYTLYADWRTERTITLDNQEATEAGTDKVVTAYCPNNNMMRLSTAITCPTKTGMTFKGYYTEANGQGVQLIDATGAFKASVAGYTDKDRWFIKDADITLYAYWAAPHHITYVSGGAAGIVPEDANEYIVGDKVTLASAEGLSNPGHDFDRWKVTYMNGDEAVEVAVSNGKFTMPNYDVTATGIWKLKSVAGTTVNTEKPVTEVEDNANVVVENGGDLQVTAEKTLDTVYINVGGKVTTTEVLTVEDVVIKASASATGTSGQIINAADDKLEINGNAYFDLTLAKGGTADQWHAFTVPFQVDMINGIYDLDGNKLTNEVNYAIMVYQGDVRAQGKYGWIKVPKTGNTILQPGTFYIMATDGERTTYRMKMYGEFSVASTSIPVTYYTGDGETTDYGWNGIGNSQLDYRMVDATVQVLDPESYTFVPYRASDAAHFAVGTPFFYQAGSTTTTIELEKELAPTAPMRAMSNEPKEIAVTLANEDYTDRLFISSTEGAIDAYQIGRDLSKMSMTSTPAVPQIFAMAYDTKLCMVDAPMYDDEATYNLSLYAPMAGTYTLAAAQVEGYEIFLTCNGELIWNLSMNAYPVELNKGSDDTYGLILKKMPNTPTDISSSYTVHATPYTKFIYNDQLIIIRDGKAYNGVGALLK